MGWFNRRVMVSGRRNKIKKLYISCFDEMHHLHRFCDSSFTKGAIVKVSGADGSSVINVIFRYRMSVAVRNVSTTTSQDWPNNRCQSPHAWDSAGHMNARNL